MVILVTLKNDEDPFKSEDTRVVTTLFMDCLDAQGSRAANSVSVMESCQISNTSKHLQLVYLSVRMKKNHSKMKAVDCSQHITDHKSFEIFTEAHLQLTPQPLVGSR